MERWRLLWGRVRDSLWFVPAAITLLCGMVAVVLVHLERNGSVDLDRELVWLFGGGGSAAREVLSTIAGSLITVTGVVFSVMVIALQLASSQYTPRVLRNFVGDRTNQIVLGILIGTFTYSLLVMRTIRSEAEDQERFVPALAVTVAIALLLVSVGAIITFINHSTRSILVEHIVERQYGHTMAQIRRQYPGPLGQGLQLGRRTPVFPTGSGAEVSAPRGGYVQAVEEDRLFELACGCDATFELVPRVGDFVLPREPLLHVWPADRLTPELCRELGDSVLLGHSRTYEQDPRFGVLGIADIAQRALSPSLNDPSTAVLCIDRLAEVLAELASRELPSKGRFDDAGTARLLMRHPHFEQFVALSIGHVRQHGMNIPTVVLKLLDTLRRLGPLVPPQYRAPLAAEARAILAAAREQVTVREDLAAAEELARQALAWLGAAHADGEDGGAGSLLLHEVPASRPVLSEG